MLMSLNLRKHKIRKNILMSQGYPKFLEDSDIILIRVVELILELLLRLSHLEKSTLG